MPVPDACFDCDCAQFNFRGFCGHTRRGHGLKLSGRASGGRVGRSKQSKSNELSLAKTCQFNQTGYCKFGSRCKFRVEHEKQLAKQEEALKRQNEMAQHSASKQYQAQETAIAKFFGMYGFKYNPANPATSEFYRMRVQFGWKSDDKDLVKAKDLFRAALVAQFNDMYGTEDSLNGWQKIAKVVGCELKGHDCAEYKKALSAIYFNLVDLVDHKDPASSILSFASSHGLKEYTSTTKKFFPKDCAALGAGGLLLSLCSIYSTRANASL